MIIGLPYPDITDPELKEKMRVLNKEYQEKKINVSGNDYYKNLCMRAVNQSIGRAIRHANDYSVIVLADFRYSTDLTIWNGLPQWIRSGANKPPQLSFQENLSGIEAFFKKIRATNL